MAQTWDYIVVGAGSAGCALAARLSAGEARVLLLEAGGEARSPWLHVPVGYFRAMHNPAMDWLYKTQPDPGLGGRALSWPRGKTMGGSSAINGLLYIRGQAQDYDDWAAAGCDGWSYADVLPYFKRAEDQERGASAHHGVGGPLAVSNIRARRPVCDAFIDSAVACGIPRNDDFNGATQEGAGYFQVNIRGRFRCSSARAYLSPAVRRRPNLRIVTRAHAARVLFAGKRARGVEYIRGGKRLQAEVGERGEVVLAAGAINSPQLLMLSGVGCPRALQSAGVSPLHSLPGVGGNLQDHLQLRAVYEVSVPTLNNEVATLAGRAKIFLQYALLGGGPMAMAASQVAVFARSPAAVDSRPDVQFHFQPLSANTPGALLDSYSGVSLSVCQLRPQSRGQVELQSPKFDDAPAIVPNYLSTDFDRQTAVAALRLTRRIAAARPFANYVLQERKPGAACGDDEGQLLAAAQAIAETIYHPVGTCKMGKPQDSAAVVDPHCRVLGMQNLRVVDASVMPLIPSGNTNAPTIMIAEKAADLIKKAARAE